MSLPCIVVSLPGAHPGPVRPEEIPAANWALWELRRGEYRVIASDPDLESFLESAAKYRAALDAAIRDAEKAAGVRECGNHCGEWVRPARPGADPGDYEVVHLSGNPVCDGPALAC
jgi:hypothetical protein